MLAGIIEQMLGVGGMMDMTGGRLKDIIAVDAGDGILLGSLGTVGDMPDDLVGFPAGKTAVPVAGFVGCPCGVVDVLKWLAVLFPAPFAGCRRLTGGCPAGVTERSTMGEGVLARLAADAAE